MSDLRNSGNTEGGNQETEHDERDRETVRVLCNDPMSEEEKVAFVLERYGLQVLSVLRKELSQRYSSLRRHGERLDVCVCAVEELVRKANKGDLQEEKGEKNSILSLLICIAGFRTIDRWRRKQRRNQQSGKRVRVENLARVAEDPQPTPDRLAERTERAQCFQSRKQQFRQKLQSQAQRIFDLDMEPESQGLTAAEFCEELRRRFPQVPWKSAETVGTQRRRIRERFLRFLTKHGFFTPNRGHDV